MTTSGNNPIILSTDTLPGFGLDLIFKTAKESGFDGIDLALWKNYDARHEDYVAELSANYKLPIRVVQVSNKPNAREMNKALQICELNKVKKLLINAPKYFDIKSYSFLTNNIKTYQKHYSDISFGIINPDDNSMPYLPFPKYRFRNIGEIIKTLNLELGFDISNMDEEIIQNLIIGQGKEIISKISNCYVSDRTKSNHHILPGEGNYNLPAVFKALKKYNYSEPFSVKLTLDTKTLINNENVIFQLQKTIEYIKTHSSIAG